MAEGQGVTKTATQDKKGGAPVVEENSSWFSRPENLGNSAGSRINETLSPLGEPLGKGVETVTKPVGNVVDGVVGGVMRSGEAVGGVLGVKETGREGEKKGNDGSGLGGKEQTAENPLGL